MTGAADPAPIRLLGWFRKVGGVVRLCWERLFRRDRGRGTGSTMDRPLSPAQVRSRRFTQVGGARRGVDPVEVAEFLDQVAGELTRAYAQLAAVQAQNARIRNASHRWLPRQVSSTDGRMGR